MKIKKYICKFYNFINYLFCEFKYIFSFKLTIIYFRSFIKFLNPYQIIKNGFAMYYQFALGCR